MKEALFVLVDGQGMKPDELLHPLFSDKRIRKINASGAEKARLDMALAEIAYLFAFKCAFGTSGKDRYAYGENGKPYFVNEEYGYLSLSHASGIGACVIAPVPVGCDVEGKTRDLSKIDRRIRNACAPETQDALSLWCIKESHVKLTGNGLKQPFSSLLYKDGGMILSDDGKPLSRVHSGDLKRCVWAVSAFEDVSVRTLYIRARDAYKEIG